VLIADDHALVREGIGLLLQFDEGFEVVAEAANGHEALELAQKHTPDVVLMDVNMPEMDGIEATRRLKEVLPGVHVIGLSMHEQGDLAESMREAGADGYISKAAPSDELLKAIRREIGLGQPARSEPAEEPVGAIEAMA
jgi:two-component system response regulator DegU